MSVNVEIKRNPNESTSSVLRRFTKRVQMAGHLPKVRGGRYHARTLSDYKTKVKTLESLKRREEVEDLIKMGKMTERTSRHG